MGMDPFARIFVFIKRRPIEAVEGKIVGGKMGGHPIENHANAVLVQMIDEKLEIGRPSHSGLSPQKIRSPDSPTTHPEDVP